jgi:hypothetical protein
MNEAAGSSRGRYIAAKANNRQKNSPVIFPWIKNQEMTG